MIQEEPLSALAEHARIPIAFEVRSVLDVDGMVERPVAQPWIKDYDAAEDIAGLATRFDLANWGLLSAWHDRERIGGAVIAYDTPGVTMLEGRRDLAVLWDIRVAPARRRSGVGAALFRAAEAWARARGCVRLDVETQNINVPACRFYARMGCELRAIDRFAYRDLPGEVELLWTRHLS